VNERIRSLPLHRWLLVVAVGLSAPAVPIGILTWVYRWSSALFLVNVLAIAVLVIVAELRRQDFNRDRRDHQRGRRVDRLCEVVSEMERSRG